MDKYEYKLKTDQMKVLASEGNYEEAAKIADSINWRKVKNTNFLVKVGEVYEKVGRLEEARDVLLMAYDRSPIGRMIIYRLAELAIKMKNFDEAEEYYDEFVELAPNDNLRYVIRYKLSRAKGESLADGIRILEALKDEEYSEEWAYELAYMYHRAGAAQKCVDACDELILWFGEGDYVERALELKMLYQPLTKAQEEKYKRFGRQAAGMSELYANDKTVVIPRVEVNNDKFNTVNLQEEIAKSMQQIMDATERETVTDTMENIKKMVSDVPYMNVAQEEIPETIQEQNKELDENLRNTFREYLAEEADGQMSLRVPEYAGVEQQITGQLRIDEILEEWEKTKRAAEAALMDAERARLENEKTRALQEAGDIMERLAGVIPQLGGSEDPAEILRQQYLKEDNDVEAGKFMEDMNRKLQEQIDALSSDETPEEEAFAEGGYEDGVINMDTQVESAEEISLDDIELPEISLDDILEDPQMTVSEVEEMTGAKKTADRFDTARIDEQIGLKPYVPVQFEDDSQTEEENNTRVETNEEIEEDVKEDIKENVKEASADKADEVDENDEDADIKIWRGRSNMPAVTELNDDLKEIFSYFVPVSGMPEQLCKALTGVGGRVTADGYTKVGNLIIQGGEGTGKTVLATSFIKSLQKITGKPEGKIGKIDAHALNKKDIGNVLGKVIGGAIIIEKAGELSEETVAGICHFLDMDESGLLIILEDTRAGIRKVMDVSADFAQRFTERLNIPVFTNDELVLFAKAYANDLDYDIDEMGVLALYNRISNIQRIDSATTLTEVKEIIDEAIEHFNKGGIFARFRAKKTEDSDYSILRERDFGE
ncbi:MAG: tetratricopeptide repeat protein [Lachnospiraceae bacterium]|nr:tetratricopeptide repeat protein [Lachnospiraceae bacterium]